MPLAVVIASIMTFGSFAESYEFAAMKASGISLMRVMRPLIILMALLSIGTFFLANNVIPVAYREVYTLRSNIAKVKPAMAIAEGVFSNIGEDISIKVGKKSGDNDQFLESVLIHKKTPDRVNRTVINAKRGELRSAKSNPNFLQLILEDGTYYEDIKTNTYETQQRMPFAKVHFQKYVINLDLSHLNNVDFNEKGGRDMPTAVHHLWLSYAERKFYQLDAELSENTKERMLKMFRKPYYISDDNEHCRF